jgi:hypothetical protein
MLKMKRTIFAISILLLSDFSLPSQTAPQGMNFQAVARDAEGAVLTDQPVRLRAVLRQGGPDGKVVFRESHLTATNEFGAFHLIIGEGDQQSASLGEAPWHTGNIWMEIALDATGGENFRVIHSARLLSVPYAFFAQTAGAIAIEKDRSDCRVGGIPFWPTTGHPVVDSNHYLGTNNQQALIFRTDNLDRLRISGDSQKVFVDGILWVPELHLKADAGKFSVGKSDKAFANYPVRIRNARQGVAVKLNEPEPDGSHNFMAFFDSTGNVLGRIEGQTQREFLTDFGLDGQRIPEYIAGIIPIIPYLRFYDVYGEDFWAGVINSAMPFLEFIACSVQSTLQGGGAPATPNHIETPKKKGEKGEALVNFFWSSRNAAEFATNLALALEKVGVAYESGGADYAEWLEKADPDDHFLPGEIVGVVGGKIRRDTRWADQVMVISGNPVLLGNQPPEEKSSQYAKTAFLGQVPVRVRGPVTPGDYILPSGRNDGWGIAVAPEAIQPEDYRQIVGVAWIREPKGPEAKLINVAVGLDDGGLAEKLMQQKADTEALRERLTQLTDYLSRKSGYQPKQPVAATPVKRKAPDIESFRQWINDNGESLERHFHSLRDYYQSTGMDLDGRPSLKALLENPAEYLEGSLSDPQMQTLWELLNKQNQWQRKD